MKTQSNPETVTIPAEVYVALVKACLAVADHEGDAMWQEDFFKVRDLATVAINKAALKGLLLS